MSDPLRKVAVTRPGPTEPASTRWRSEMNDEGAARRIGEIVYLAYLALLALAWVVVPMIVVLIER